MNLKILGIICCLLFTALVLAPSHSWAVTSSCSAPEYRQFDFWIGNWDAFEIEKPDYAVAHNRVERILDGCALLEDYQAPDGSHGESFSIYDASRKLWHQSWVTNKGVLLAIEGNLEGDALILSGTDRADDGKERLVRGTWKRVAEGVRETAVRSTDGGRTWTPWFDLIFRPSAQSGSGNNVDDKAMVSALDTQYQLAVKNNDAATMDRLLAADFILRTGSGKAYNKADLVNEAHGGKVIYQHQEDTDQSVLVFGDTAVITAKLWEKGTDNGKAFDYTVWFSDTYIRTPSGWRYVFGQSSLPLPKPQS
ncbi:MAG TPA: nuclear transport factor 2 family protein [Candidatus Solibacter sp.]|nr:nuclear transport factor 2 family protein [Candidatus Solibacter sp.]